MWLTERLTQRLEVTAEQEQLRCRTARTTQVYAKPEQSAVLTFNSNDYLGLSQDERLHGALTSASYRYGVGSGSAQTIDGFTESQQALEQALADWSGYEAALIFSTGYQANLGVLTALTQADDIILQDRLNHASLLDAGRLASGRSYRYAHQNIGQLAAKLQTHRQNPCFIVTDGLFSMQGTKAPLPQLIQLAKTYQAMLITDEAHSFGIFGNQGLGLREHYHLNHQDMPIVTGTFGKAFGGFGAFVLGNKQVIAACQNYARTFLFTTALPPAIIAANHAALTIMQTEPQHRQKLWANIQYFQQLMQDSAISCQGDGVIQIITLPNERTTMRIKQQLLDKNIKIGAIRPPTVPNNNCCLRITLSAAHQTWQIEHLVQQLVPLLQGIYDSASI